MESTNFQRMIALADEVFSYRTDPEQLDVNEAVIEKLHTLHASTLSEHVLGDGPVVWILLIPTTLETMHQFINSKITERQLLEQTKAGEMYEAIYLCSALVLPEFRRKGLAKQLTLEAIHKIQYEYPIKFLYVWPFSKEGEELSELMSEQLGLPLLARKMHD